MDLRYVLGYFKIMIDFDMMFLWNGYVEILVIRYVCEMGFCFLKMLDSRL